MDFHQIFRVCLPQKDVELIRFLGGYPMITFAMATLLKIFQILKFVFVPQIKPLHGFLPNFQGMFIPRGSRAY